MDGGIEAAELGFNATLSPGELLLLDGRCSGKLQAEVDLLKEGMGVSARHGIPLAHGHFVARAVREARGHGRLLCRPVPMERCPVTGRRAERRTPSRKTRENPFKDPVPVPFHGYELKEAHVTVRGHPHLGCCADALDALRPVLAAELDGVLAEVPELVTGHPSVWVREDLLRCKHCSWEGRRNLVEGRNPHWFGTTCPGCGHQGRGSGFFGEFERTDRFEVVSKERWLEEAREASVLRAPWKGHAPPTAPSGPVPARQA